MGLGVCMSLILLYRLYTILYTCHYHKPYYYYYSYSLGHGANNLKSFLIASYGLSVSLLFEMYLIHDNLTSNYFKKRKNDRSRPKANIPIYPNKAVNHSSLPLYSLFSWVAPKSLHRPLGQPFRSIPAYTSFIYVHKGRRCAPFSPTIVWKVPSLVVGIFYI